MQSSNSAAVVAAMNKFWASDGGKEYPADVAIAQELFNGSCSSKHLIIITFRTRHRNEI
tara:strand:- start:362 stop:538 length:177 start_codon:yes stop_codon:yes gene_type:complete